MFHTNNKQSVAIDELIQLFLVPDIGKDRWRIKQIYFYPSSIVEDEFDKITFVLIDNKDKEILYFKSIDINGALER
jgi:CRISPR/Cas system CSM-associated protein Csm4 (group 5 of RAMP superfamily)